MRRLPVTAVVATCNRPRAIRLTLDSLQQQQVVPAELIVVDASDDDGTRRCVEEFARRTEGACAVRWSSATTRGAAAQRNQGVQQATQPFIWFFDDDIVFERDCVSRLWRALEADATLGGISAMIVNQQYRRPGAISKCVFTLLDGRYRDTFAGRVIGPAVNLLPEDAEHLPDVVSTEWLNTTCTIYRREALPSPPFDAVFTGYSLMEDLALSLHVSRQWRLANARTARIIHEVRDRVAGETEGLAGMELENRHHIMTKVLRRTGTTDYLKLILWELFQVASMVSSGSASSLWASVRGKKNACHRIRQRHRQDQTIAATAKG